MRRGLGVWPDANVVIISSEDIKMQRGGESLNLVFQSLRAVTVGIFDLR